MRTKLSKRGWWSIGIAVVVLLGGAGGATYLLVSGSPAVASASPTVVTASDGTVTQTVSASGTIEPASQANLDFPVSGQVTAVDVHVGQVIKAGQTLATVSTTSLQASVDSAQATLDTDEARLTSDQNAAASSAQITSDQAAVNAAQANLSDAQKSLSEASLTSPIDGTVATVNLSVGQEVSGGGGSGGGGGGSGGLGGGGGGGLGGSAGASSSSSSSSSNAQVVVIGTGAWVVDASVDDTQIAQVQNGDQATIAPEGATSVVYGTVGSVGLIASTTSGVSTFPVTINITGNPAGLYAGTSANVSIIVKELQNVLVVPTRALRFSGGQVQVQVEQGSQIVTRNVTVGTTSGAETQIVSGLSAGDRVVVPTIRSTTGTSGTANTARGGATRGGGAGGARGGFGGGGFGGGGFGGGGFGGGGFGGGGARGAGG